MKRPAKAAGGLARLRCAIYTRKSSEEGLEQNFNSLHAQREACEAYVLSQVGEGWGALAAQYDDGGFSGGSMERPGLTQLLADVDAGRIDIVVVYKVDRLTRSLADFAKIVERFDARGVSFVSVTQAFNTTTSMGRLTLNVLLSFAQFEREVTGERIRDKIAASKAKGMWMGGNIPLGYDTEGRALVVNPAEAEQVRQIFRRYLALGSVHGLRRALSDEGVRSKRRVTLNGKAIGGAGFSRGALFYLLSNRHYLGEIVHKEKSYPGAHAAIVDAELFEAVQLKLAENAGEARRARTGLEPRPPAAPLAGLVFDDRGNAMSSVQARKNGRLYRYYVSTAIQQGRAEEAGSLPRFPGPVLEDLLRDRLGRLELIRGVEDLAAVIERIEVGRTQVIVRLDIRDRVPSHANVVLGDQFEILDDTAVLTILTHLKWRGGAKCAVGPSGAKAVDTPKPDLALLRALARAEAWKARMLGDGLSMDQLIAEQNVNRSYAQRLVRLAFLAPEIKRAILDGRTPQGVTLQRLMQGEIPLAWADQRYLANQ
jgi:DNA invertase Pin-like site-specific DNA recombinase